MLSVEGLELPQGISNKYYFYNKKHSMDNLAREKETHKVSAKTTETHTDYRVVQYYQHRDNNGEWIISKQCNVPLNREDYEVGLMSEEEIKEQLFKRYGIKKF